LKKRSKKLLLTAGLGADIDTTRRSRSFLLLFFKKEALSSFATQGLTGGHGGFRGACHL
jgi:hypothetical protein